MSDQIRFAAPGPGEWQLEAGHHGHRPLSGYIAETYRASFEAGSVELLERYGLPLERIRMELVHGCTYVRPVGVGEGDKPSKSAPPVPVMKVLALLHPGLRRRNRAAASAWEQKRWRTDVDRWFTRDRDQVVAASLAFQRVDVTALDDAALVAHLDALRKHFAEQARANIANHGGDLIPVGDYLARCAQWGISSADAAALLRGSSPETTVTTRLDKDAWLERHAWRVLTTDDIDEPTLAERPELQAAALSAATAAPEMTPDPSPIRAQVPEGERALFDELLHEARYGLRQRDDVVGTRWNWSAGLLRRALLEVGRRGVDRERLHDPEHAFEATPDEIAALLAGTGPNGATLAARRDFRDRVEAAGPPKLLGDPEAPPPLAALPAPMRRATVAMLTMLEADDGVPSDDPLHGTRIGAETYRGRARVVSDADDALDRLEPGDVLVTQFTGPAYNSILPLIGALVTEHGGPMCHAAIVAREFGLPAIIGASGATTHIPDGAFVEVKPQSGIVTVVS